MTENNVGCAPRTGQLLNFNANGAEATPYSLANGAEATPYSLANGAEAAPYSLANGAEAAYGRTLADITFGCRSHYNCYKLYRLWPVVSLLLRHQWGQGYR